MFMLVKSLNLLTKIFFYCFALVTALLKSCYDFTYTSHDLFKEEIIQTFSLKEEGITRQVTDGKWQKILDDFYVYYTGRL